MKKLFMYTVIVVCLLFSLPVHAAETFQNVMKAVLADNLYNRAPDVLPGTIPEMRDPEFWIARMEHPDEVILSAGKIRAMNEAYQQKIKEPDPFRGVSKELMPNLDHWWPGYVIVVPDLENMSSAVVADTVKSRISLQVDYLRSRKFGNALAVVYSDREIDAYIDKMALDRVPDRVKIVHALTVRPTRLRNAPTFPPMEAGLWQNGKTRWDAFNVCLVSIATPVRVLHVSRTGEYALILCREGYGWLRCEDMAFGTEEAINAFADPQDFFMCTGDRVLFYADESCTYASGYFRMGDRLPVTEKGNNRLVTIPVRDVDGTLRPGRAWLAGDAEISVGLLPFTRRNIVRTAFKLLDNPYDWTGGWYGRDHETTYRNIFACFGFELPLFGELFPHFGNSTQITRPEMTKQEHYDIIAANEPFVTIQVAGTHGHGELYLGMYEGEPIIFDQHGYGYTDEDGTWFEVRRCSISDMRLPSYNFTSPIRFLELK